MMASMKRYLFSLLLCCASLSGEDFQMRDRLVKAKSGDYIVTEANKMITVVAIRSSSPNSLVFEEISVPLQNLKKMPASWAE